MGSRTPARLSEHGVRGDIARAVNQLADEVRRSKLVARPGQKVEETPNGTLFDPGVKQASGPYMGDDVFY